VALTERLQIIVTADGKGAAREFQQIGATAERELGRTEDRIKKLSSGLVSSGSQMALAGGIATAGVFKLAQAAGNYEEAASAASVVFGEASESVEQFGRDAITSAGLSRRAAVDAAVTFGTFGKAAGLTGENLATFSTDLTQLAGDLASFRNTSTDEAITAIGAALRGESEPIRRYGVLLDDATLKQEALELGIYDGVGALTQQQKVLAAQAAIFEQTSDAQGDYNRTSESLSNQTKTFSAQLENLQVALGEGAVPVFSELLELTNGALEGFQNLSPETQNLVGQFGAIAAIGTTVVGGFGVLAGGALRLVETFGDLRGRLRDNEGALTRTGRAAAIAGGLIGAAGAAFAVYQLGRALNESTQDALGLETALNNLRNAKSPEEVAQALQDAAASSEGYIDRLLDFGTSLGFGPGSDPAIFVEGVRIELDNVADVLQKIKDTQPESLPRVLEAFRNADTSGIDDPFEFQALEDVNALLGDYEANVASSADTANTSFKDLGPLFGGVARETEDAADATEDLANQFDTAKANADLFAAILGNAEARLEGFDRTIANSTALDDYLSSGLRLNESLGTLAATVGQLPANIDASAIAFTDLSEEGVDALNNLLGLGDAIQSSLQTALQFGSPDQVRQQADRIRAELRKVFESVGITGERFNEYLEILGLTPKQIDTAITVSGEAEALAKIEVFRDSAELLAAPVELQVAVAEAQLAGDLTSASNLIDAWFTDKQDGLIDNPFLIALGLGETGNADADLEAWRRKQSGQAVRIPISFEILQGPPAPPLERDSRGNPTGRIAAGPPAPPRRRRAAGGPVEFGRTYMVNEAGPEMFRPATDGFIMNAASTERLIRGVEALVTGGSGDVINIYETAGPRQTAEELIRSKSANRFLAGVA
jgi:hypothetical protein